MEDKPSLKLIFFSLIPNESQITAFRLSFSDIIHQINSPEKTHPIPEDVFKYDKDRAEMSMELYNSENKKLNTIKFPVHYGKNTKYFEKEGDGNGLNFELIFKNCENLKITNLGKEFNSFDDNNTKDRKKISFLNYNLLSIDVNSIKINIHKEIQNIQSSSRSYYQLSIVNLQENKIIVQVLEDIEKPDFQKLMRQKKAIDDFFKELLDLFTDEYNYKNHYFLILNTYKHKIKYINFNLNTSNSYLEEYFKNISVDLNIVYKYMIFDIFSDGKRKYSNNKKLFQKTVDEINKFYDKIINETKIKIYEKIMLIAKITWLYFECMNIESLNRININYFILSECEENSIIDKAIKFLKDFVSDLKEESKVFPYLLNIDSGLGYYKGEYVYTFDMTNLKTIKTHLNGLFPNVLLFYYLDDGYLAHINKCIACIAINKYNLFRESSSDDIVFDKFVEKEVDKSDDMAINLFILLLHECMGHKKFGYNRSNSISPKKIFNEKNNIVTLERCCDYKNDKDEDKEYILGKKCKNKGDSGSFLELAYGTYRRSLITQLMLRIKDKGQLIKRVDLFTDNTCEKLKKYIILKFIAMKRGINIPKSLSVEQEISEYEKYINYEELISEKSFSSENEVQFLQKKTKRPEEKGEDYSDLDIAGKNKKKKTENMNFEIMNNFDNEIIEGEDDNENESEEDDYDDSEYFDNEKLYEKLYKKVIERYEFKEDEQLMKNIFNKMNDDSIKGNEIDDLRFVFNYMNNVE